MVEDSRPAMEDIEDVDDIATTSKSTEKKEKVSSLQLLLSCSFIAVLTNTC